MKFHQSLVCYFGDESTSKETERLERPSFTFPPKGLALHASWWSRYPNISLNDELVVEAQVCVFLFFYEGISPGIRPQQINISP